MSGHRVVGAYVEARVVSLDGTFTVHSLSIDCLSTMSTPLPALCLVSACNWVILLVLRICTCNKAVKVEVLRGRMHLDR
jgi:hypothetical protein